MLDENMMISLLIQKLHKAFWKNAITSFITLIIVFIFCMASYIQFLNETESLVIIILCFALVVVVLVIGVISLLPFKKDMKLAKSGKIESITGTVVSYKKIVHGGDPTSYSYLPIIKDIHNDWIEVEVKADNTVLNKIYHCVYLPNTKLGFCVEFQSLENQIQK